MRGDNVWLTGASSGIGEALAHQLAHDGARLTLTARRRDKLDEVAAECRTRGSAEVTVAPADITSAEEVAAAYALATADQPVDIAIFNAGAWTQMPASEFSADEIDRQFGVNVVGTARCIEAVLSDMRARGAGRIVIVASLTAFTGLPLASSYGATKAALRAMGDSLRADLAGTGVEVTVVYPGFVRTAMTDVNEFDMPGIMDPTDAARIIARGVARGHAEVSFPRGLSIALKTLGAAPGALRRPLVARMGRSIARKDKG